MKWRVGVVVVLVLVGAFFSRSMSLPESEPSREVTPPDRRAKTPTVNSAPNCAEVEAELIAREAALPPLPKVPLALWTGQLKRVAGEHGGPPTSRDLESLATLERGLEVVPGATCDESPCLIAVLGSAEEGGIPFVEPELRARVEELGGHVVRPLIEQGRMGAWVSTSLGEPTRMKHRMQTRLGVRPERGEPVVVERVEIGPCPQFEARAAALESAERGVEQAVQQVAYAKAVVEAVEGVRGEPPPVDGPNSPTAVEAIAASLEDEHGWESLLECEEAPCLLNVNLVEGSAAGALTAVEKAIAEEEGLYPLFIPDCTEESCTVTVVFNVEPVEDMMEGYARSNTRHKALTAMWVQ